MHVKTEKELYICPDRPRSTLSIFGLVVDRNRVDVVVESGPLQFHQKLCIIYVIFFATNWNTISCSTLLSDNRQITVKEGCILYRHAILLTCELRTVYMFLGLWIYYNQSKNQLIKTKCHLHTIFSCLKTGKILHKETTHLRQ